MATRVLIDNVLDAETGKALPKGVVTNSPQENELSVRMRIRSTEEAVEAINLIHGNAETLFGEEIILGPQEDVPEDAANEEQTEEQT